MKVKIITAVLLAATGFFFTLTLRADNMALMGPVKSVYNHYLKIQADLANDSLKGVPAEANAIAEAVRGDSMKMLPENVAAQAQTLAKATDLAAARAAFKPLSGSLIQYLGGHNAKGAYVEFYCPMAKAGWLQAGKDTANPYMGQAGLTCGIVKN
ncbi:MAG: DUF3347 domain-containing protein [Verrucomicrobia bacterium]|nr:DUF3347 domain-containing protein [Verrucomicrobiota bacterium]MDE3098397.1 DUF3347 domain-containing protein [Verrucomicrobiota bacterium]